MDAQGYESASDANLDCCCKICCTLTCRMREVDLRKCTVLLKLEYLYHLFIHTSSSLEEKKKKPHKVSFMDSFLRFLFRNSESHCGF